MLLGQTLNILKFNHYFLNFSSDEILITVIMKGETPTAHADAILAYYNFTKSNEDTFKTKYGYDLRQNLIETYSTGDERKSHEAIGGGRFKVLIEMSRTLVEQIESVKNPISSSLNDGDSIGNSNFSVTDFGRPTTVAKNATPAEKGFYQAIDLLKTQAMNFGSRMVQDADVRADYLKTIKYASEEFIELVKSGKISYEEGARRAGILRNYILEVSRGKNSDLGRALAEFLKKEGPTLQDLLTKYAKSKFQRVFSILSQAEQEAVYFEVIVAAGRDRKTVSGIAPYLGKFGKVCLVASIAISVYNVATSEDKVNAVGREGSGILGGFAGGAAGGALAGLICGPGAPICSGIGIFVGGAVGAFAASGGYDWLTSK